MAKKKQEAKKTLERTYNIPLRGEYMKVAKYKRAKKAGKAVKEFLIKHMKPGEDEKGRILIKVSENINKELWKHGIKNPPHHIKVNVTKYDDNKVTAELFGFKEKVKEKIKDIKEKIEEKEQEINPKEENKK